MRLTITALAVSAGLAVASSAALAAPTQRTEMAPAVVAQPQTQLAFGYWFCVDTMYKYGLRRGYNSDLALLAAAEVCGQHYAH